MYHILLGMETTQFGEVPFGKTNPAVRSPSPTQNAESSARVVVERAHDRARSIRVTPRVVDPPGCHDPVYPDPCTLFLSASAASLRQLMRCIKALGPMCHLLALDVVVASVAPARTPLVVVQFSGEIGAQDTFGMSVILKFRCTGENYLSLSASQARGLDLSISKSLRPFLEVSAVLHTACVKFKEKHVTLDFVARP